MLTIKWKYKYDTSPQKTGRQNTNPAKITKKETKNVYMDMDI